MTDQISLRLAYSLALARQSGTDGRDTKSLRHYVLQTMNKRQALALVAVLENAVRELRTGLAPVFLDTAYSQYSVGCSSSA